MSDFEEGLKFSQSSRFRKKRLAPGQPKGISGSGGGHDSVNRVPQGLTELGVGLIGRQSLGQRPGKTRNHSRVLTESAIGFFTTVSTGQGRHSGQGQR